MFAPPSLVDHGVIEQIPRIHPTASTTNGAMPAAGGGGALLFPAGTDAAGGSPRPSISRQNTSSQKRSSASTAVTISTADLVAWDQSVTEMSWLMKHIAQGVAAQQQRNAMLHQQQQQSNNTYHHKVRGGGGGLMDGNNNNHVDASNHSNNANGAGSSSSPPNPTAKSAATGRPHRFGDAANIVEGAAAAVGRATSAAILLNAGHHQREALPLPRHVFGAGGGSILAPTGTNDSDTGLGGEFTGRSHSHGGGVSMPFVPVTFVSRSEPHKEVSLEPNGSPDVSQHSSSDHAPPGGENIHISNEGGAGGASTLTEALGGGHHKVMIQSSESANEGSGGGRTEGGNNSSNNTPDLLVTTLSSKIAELHQHIAHVQSMFAVSIDIESFGSAFPAPEYPSPQNPQPQLPAQRPRGFSSSQDAGGQSGGMHPHFLHSPSSASGPSPPTGNSGYYYNRGSFGPSPYQQHNAVQQTTFLPTNASVFSAGGGAGGGAFPLSQLRSSVRIHQSVLNALNNNNNNGGGSTTVSASPAMNGNHYGGYHHGMSVMENIFNAIQMEHSMSRAPGESYSKLPIPTTTTTLTKDTDETGSKSINQYLILDVIGQGACGKVKLALDLNRGTTVAIKQVRKSSKPTTTKSTESAAAAATTTSPLIGSPLSMNPKLGRRVDAQLASLKREIAIMKKIRHKNVVALHEVIDDPHADKMYLIMQYVDQGSVGAVKFDGTCEALPLRKVADIVAQVASGLHFLHASGVVHRDIKPENILSSSEGHVYLSDFGVSTLTDRGNNGAGGVNGTPLVGKQLPIGSPTFKSVSANETSATTFSPLATNMGGNGGGGGGTLLFMPPEYFKDGLTSSLNSTTSPADSTTTATGAPFASSPSSPTEGGSRLPPPIKTSSLASTGVTLTSPFERQCAGDIWALGVTIYVLVYGRLPFPTMDLLLDSSFTPEFPTTSTFDPARGDDTLAGSTETSPPNIETVPKKLLALLKAMLSREAVLRPRPHQIRSVAKLLKRELQTVEEQESSIDNDLLMMAATMTPTSNVAPPPGLQLSSGGGIASAHSKRHGATIRVSIRDLEDALTPAGGLATPPQNELLRKFSSHLGPLELPSSVGFDGVRGAVSPSSPPPASAQSAEFESPSRTSPTRSLQPRPPSSETPGTRRPMTTSPGP